MSGQYPHPSAPSSQQFNRQHGPPHHLPPAPQGQYCPPQGPSQRMRGAPPQHWGHPTHNTGLNTVGGGLVYGSPHLSGYGIPGRTQPWPKPSENRYSMPTSGNNPLFNLQMQLSQNLMPSVVSESRLSGDYNQEETIDLSSHSVSAENRREREVLRNGAVLENTPAKLGESAVKVTDSTVNGEFGESSFKTGTNITENKDIAVSVIAHNPLSDILNCSKTDKVECSVVKIGETSVTRSVEPLVKNSSNLVIKSPEVVQVSPERGSDSDAPEYLGVRSPDFIKSYVNTEVSAVKNFPVSENLSVKSPESSVVKNPEIVNVKSRESSVKISENFNVQNTESSVLKIPEPQYFSSTIRSPESPVKIFESSSQISENVVSKKLDDVPKNLEVSAGNTNPAVDSIGGLSFEKPVSTNNRPFADLGASSNSNTKPGDVSVDVSLESSLLLVSDNSREVSEKDETDPLFISSPERNEDNLGLEGENTSKSDVLKNVPQITNDWENSNHTAENVESILENMFNAQDEKPSQTAPQSVIVSNDSRSSLFDELRTEKSTIIVPMKVEELAETLLEEPQEIKSEKKDESIEKMMDELHGEKENMEVKPKEEIDTLEEQMEAEETKENIPKAVVKPMLNQPSALRLLRKNLPENDRPSIATAATTPVEVNTNVESEKNPFIEVESELEKMFAGIVEPASEAMNENQVMPGAETSVESKKPFTNKRAIARRKTPNRRLSDTNVFGSEGKKKLNKRLSDVDGKKTKRSKLESGWDISSGKKGKSFQKDTSNDSGSAVSKSKGPFIHIEGSKENPVSVVVVNSGVRPEDEEGTEKSISRRKHSNYQRSEGRAARPRGTGLYSSTLSSRYDAQTADTTWICVFCKRGPHCEGGLGGQPAGDLFGPYRISSTPPEETIVSPSDRDVAEEQKRRGSGKQQSLRTSGGVDHFVQKMARKNKRFSSDEPENILGMSLIPGETKETGYEVWTHEQCATWAPGVYIVGSKLVGIEEAVWAAVKTKCTQCGDTGAGIGCVVRNCAPRMHYGCALLCSWHLDQDTFIAKCNHHRKSYFSTGMLRPS